MPRGISKNNDEAPIGIFTADAWEYVWLEGVSQLPDIYEVLTEGWACSRTPSFMSSCLGPTPLEKNYKSKEGAVPLIFPCFKQLKCVSLLSQCCVLDITSD